MTDVWKTLSETYIGTFGRPDASGERGGGVRGKTRPHPRADNYPYDRPVSYGQPAPYDRGNAGEGPGHAGPPVPVDTDHTIWDDLDEVMGAPMLLTKAYQGAQMGNATGIPGASKGWAGMPPRPWDDEDLEEGDISTELDPHRDFHVVSSPKGFVTGLSLPTLRALGDLMPKESVWSELIRRVEQIEISARMGGDHGASPNL